ncbi:protein MTO1 homolog, mitochondrial [Strongylocentrotus purpuratus]|uniref:tRNA uridine 5-carboxymethylaminomethyl modification enzyme C-terminal subdomain domain-containing protein n=1 Tax=Strongylocentrotus purpuratus TaxID=7668 RepID=A0A7M7RDZ6_STRPU|nr:protein MTO1 homolog, mitochondrial [Strongylocentrotus purpuratus]XP_783517.4 protein MTO1 homolog, mitochondrial [Strongylocentrotus purpuratus]
MLAHRSAWLARRARRPHTFCRPVHSRNRFGSTSSGSKPLGDKERYDVIVVGGGHAGCEAAGVSARMGAQTLLLTHKIETIGVMSCNPSFGGIGKGHLMREIDALDGISARLCDKAGIQYKVLNRRKGPAVWGLRAQIDRDQYQSYMQDEILNTPNLTVRAAPVEDLIIQGEDVAEMDGCHGDKPVCSGVVLENGETIRSSAVVITTGTFLRGEIHLGVERRPAGRIGDEPSVGLAKRIEDAGFTLGRLKTGTPPRLDGRTIDYSELTPNHGDMPPIPFSFMTDRVAIQPEDQVICHLTHSNHEVHRICIDNQHLNVHVQEEANGPRYCPSIESKCLRFGDRPHQIWLEPEGLNTDIVYMQGFSVTLPPDLQEKCVNSIKGLENATMTKPGYGVEYDYVDPREIKPSLETLKIPRLFFAGQINGTTGYEEAAAQGIIAGINAVLKARRRPPFTISRTEGYIGVLIDDLTTRGTSEPYRMFTSRTEFRMTLRPDNADLRLTHRGFAAGCVSQERFEHTMETRKALEESKSLLRSVKLHRQEWRRHLENHGVQSAFGNSKSPEKMSAMDILQFPGLTVHHLAAALPSESLARLEDHRLAERLKIEGIYAPLIPQQEAAIAEVQADEELELPEDLDYTSLKLSTEAIYKLTQARPTTIGAASRLEGVTPAAVLRLLYHVKRQRQNRMTHTAS